MNQPEESEIPVEDIPRYLFEDMKRKKPAISNDYSLYLNVSNYNIVLVNDANEAISGKESDKWIIVTEDEFKLIGI